ncbi:MAG: retroviral-like aspartic protease family protein [Paludibacteraceae bacterium]|nr:retroviral-like aspartic protease family protein [Paludibacteraceae bacterium]
MKRILSITSAALLVCSMTFAKEPKRPDSYNYQRGIELVQSDQLDEGIDFLSKEVKQNRKNGYAYAWLASAYKKKSERGTALHLAELALKYLPAADKYYLAWTHYLKGRIYLEMADTTQALSCITTAIKTEPKNEDWLESRGFLYRDLKQWDKSDADFRQYIKLTPGLINGYFYLGRNLFLQEKYEQALAQYQYAHKLAERSFTYSAMAEVEVKLGRYEDAADHILESLKLEQGEETCTELMSSCKNEEFQELLLSKFHAQSLANPNVIDWHLYTMAIQRVQKNYEDAIRTCKRIQSINPDAYFDNFMADLYCDMGDWNNALKYHNKAVESDTADISYRYSRMYTYSEMDSVAQMFADIDYLVSQHPDDALLYFARAEINHFLMQYDKAVDDYTTGLAFDSSNEHGRYMRGRCYQSSGQTEKANKDFLAVEAKTKRPGLLMFVKASLGKKSEAMALADSLLQADTTENRYNVACAYALLGEKELAMSLLEQELQAGFVRFTHLRNDPDLQSLHGDELESLLQQYEAKAQERISKFNEVENNEKGEEKVVEIPFTASNGVTKVDCTINGLPLNFVFDTGASDVTISQTEANFMFKNGYLSPRDVVGKQRYQTADGNISVGTTFILNHINFGGLELTGVQASVVNNQSAPLLLGQTVLKRLGKIEIDNERRILKITTNK